MCRPWRRQRAGAALTAPRMLRAARQSCSTTSAHAPLCQPQAIQSALLARKTQKPISRRCLCGRGDEPGGEHRHRHRRPLDEIEPVHASGRRSVKRPVWPRSGTGHSPYRRRRTRARHGADAPDVACFTTMRTGAGVACEAALQFAPPCLRRPRDRHEDILACRRLSPRSSRSPSLVVGCATPPPSKAPEPVAEPAPAPTPAATATRAAAGRRALRRRRRARRRAAAAGRAGERSATARASSSSTR